jgi:hypothetical protein
MFKLKTDRQTWLIVALPDPDGKASIRLKVKMIDHQENARRKHDIIQDQVERLRAEAEAGTIESAGAMLAKFCAISEALSPEAITKDLDALVARITDWQDVGDEAGQPLAFNPDHLRALLNSASWIVKAVREALTDLDDNGRVKN